MEDRTATNNISANAKHMKITPFLWFDDKAEEAANFYVSIFSSIGGSGRKDSKIVSTSRYGEEGAKASGRPKGTVMTVLFQLEGQEFIALNGGPIFKFSPAVSFLVNCETQNEINYLWDKLSEGGEKGQCGWINKDKYGVTWQIVPTILSELLSDPDPVKSQRVMKAMLQMDKINIPTLKKAHNDK